MAQETGFSVQGDNMEIQCGSCGRKYVLPDSLSAGNLKCDGCGRQLHLPGRAAPGKIGGPVRRPAGLLEAKLMRSLKRPIVPQAPSGTVRIGFLFWAGWVLATVLGGTGGSLVSIYVHDAFKPYFHQTDLDLLRAVALLAPVGISLGACQWLILRLSGIRSWWFLTTVLGFLGASALIWLLATLAEEDNQLGWLAPGVEGKSLVLSLLMGEAFLAFLQWLSIRKCSTRGPWWIVASTIHLPAIFLILPFLAKTIYKFIVLIQIHPQNLAFGPLGRGMIGFLVFAGIGWAFQGGLLGLFLYWILDDHREWASGRKPRISRPLYLGTGFLLLILLLGICLFTFDSKNRNFHDLQRLIWLIIASTISFTLVSVILWSILLFKMWSAIPAGFARTTPERAVGYSFIPLFNLYWQFQVIHGWAVDFNRYSRSLWVQPPRMPERTALAVCILNLFCIIPYLDLLVGPICLLLTFHFFNRGIKGTNALLALSDMTPLPPPKTEQRPPDDRAYMPPGYQP